MVEEVEVEIWGEEEQKSVNQGLIVEEIEEEQKDRWWRENPRKGRTQADVIWNFFYSEDREHYRSASNVFFEYGTLYSYGDHFRLAVRVKRGIKSDFVTNADRYSVTTSGHQGLTRSYAPEGTPALPFSACGAAGILDLSKIEILDMRGDRWETEACLFRDDNRYFLSGVEQGKRQWEAHNFLVELYEPAETIEQALRQISGLSDEDWEAYQSGEIKRQGEYFFKQLGTTKELKKKKGVQKIRIEKHVDLNKPFRRDTVSGLSSLFGARNPHTATELIIIGDTEIFVRGTVRHREHKMLRLGKIWHKVTTNYVKGSWSSRLIED